MSRDLNHLDKIQDYGINVISRTIYLCGEINDEKYTEFSKNFDFLDTKAGEITIILDSNGGDVDACQAIYDTIKLSQNYVKIVVRGKANSAAAIILQAADKRFITPTSSVMVHVGEEGFPMQHPKNMERWLKKAKKDRDWMTTILYSRMVEKNTNITVSKIDNLLTFDTIYHADEAVEAGLVDEVLNFK